MASLTTRVIRNARKKGVTIYTPIQWGSLSIPTYVVRKTTRKHHLLPERPADTLWQHITVTYDTGKTKRSFKKDMRTLERIGNSRFKTGVSYNWCIDAVTGEVGRGQYLEAAGAHTINYKNVAGYSYDQNFVSIAIAVIGMPGVKMTTRAKISLVNLLKAHVEEEALTKGFDYEPHSLVASKDCPTDNIRAIMPAIRRQVDEKREQDISRNEDRVKITLGGNIQDAIRATGKAARWERKKRGMTDRWKRLRRIIRLLKKG